MNWLTWIMGWSEAARVYAFCAVLVVLIVLVITTRSHLPALVLFWMAVAMVIAWGAPACGIAPGGRDAVLCAPSGPAIPALSLPLWSAN